MKELQSLDDVFNKKLFRIPDYQRGYSWGKKQLVEFWEDLLCLDSNRSHYTGVLSIKKTPENVYSNWLDEQWLIEKRKFVPYFVVDGQQRLTTVSIFIQCLVEVVREHPEHIDAEDEEIYLGSYRLSEIVENYIKVIEPKHRETKTYKFGYETDNPSFEYLRYRIFQEENAGTISETFYTLNLENAKNFFMANLREYIDSHSLNDLEELYEKLTTRFLFNLYELDDDFDVFVAFETMNNRGKQLSDLELLKNRLIYLTTLYPDSEVAENIKKITREKINKAWGEIYHQLGRNRKSPLNDDEFLRAHWVMYFKYSRVKGNDYIRFLLDDYFNPKKVMASDEANTDEIEQVFEIGAQDDTDEEEIANSVDTELSALESRITIKDISAYVDSLKVASKVWYSTYFPQDSADLNADQQVWMDKVNRVKIGYFRPLIMAAIVKTEKEDPHREALLRSIERFLFVVFRVGRAQSNFRNSHYYRRARSIYTGEVTIPEVLTELNRDLENSCYHDGAFSSQAFKTFIHRKFVAGGDGFYAWNDLRYFLFEYEESLRIARGQEKIGWNHFVKSDSDKVSIEHIMPQTATDPYWGSRFSEFTQDQLNALTNTLGNLLPLSQSINSSLQNDSFEQKKKTKHDQDTKALKRNGYQNGSYSEIEVSKKEEWTAEEIKDRGLQLLEFMEQRWAIDFNSEIERLNVLNLSFLSVGEDADSVKKFAA